MRTKLFKELTAMEIEKIICDLYGNNAMVKACRLLNGGNFNTTYHIKTDQDKNGLVLRAAPADKSFLFEFHKDMMSAEPLFHRLLEEKEIPTLKIIKYVPAGNIIGREYILSEYLPCIAMNHSSLNVSELASVYKEMGGYIQKLHTITNDKFGWKRPGSDQMEFDTWPQFVLAYVKEVSDKAEAYELFENEHIQYLRELFSYKISLFDGVETPNMIHKDLHEGNVLLRQEDGQYNVAAIFDLDWAIFGDRKWEFLSRRMINEPFLEGYGEQVPQDTAFKEMSLLYRLLHGVFSAYVVMVEYGFEDWYEREKNDVLSLIKEVQAAVI